MSKKVRYWGGGTMMTSDSRFPCDDTWTTEDGGEFSIECTAEMHAVTHQPKTYDALLDFVHRWKDHCHVVRDTIKTQE